jgi:hypothetical protein
MIYSHGPAIGEEYAILTERKMSKASEGWNMKRIVSAAYGTDFADLPG